MADKKNAPKKNGPASTVPKKVSNKEIRKARQAAKASKERVPDGMDPKDYADAAFRKKVTIIMGSVLLVFIIGLVIFLIVSKVQYDFEGQRDDVIKALAEAGDDPAARAEVKIELDDKNYSYWISVLNESYQIDESDPDYACFEGATITLQGQFVTRVFSGQYVQYWVYRTHDDHEHEHADNGHDHEETASHAMGETTTENRDTKIPLSEINDPIEIYFDGDVEIPADGTWVEVTGIIGPDTSNSLPVIHDAQIKIIEAP
jgi:hypothetical protein